MKIMIMTDMEGVAGVLDHDNWVMQDSFYYPKGQRFLTEEVNAAVDGFFSEGVTDIIVGDGHGAGGIDPELLDPRVMLMRGPGSSKWPWELDATFSGLAFVGQHAKAGTPYSHITHTQWFNYADLSVNGVSIGEYGQLALCAMELGVPTILACGEQALAEEAGALTPGVVTVAVKRGLRHDGLEHLDTDAYRKAKLGAIHCSPAKAREMIRAGAAAAAQRVRSHPASFRYPDLKPPYVREARLRADGEIPASRTRDEHPDSIIELLNMPFTKVEK